MSTHPAADELAGYARSPESMPTARAASVEQHLLACSGCRSSVAAASPATSIGDSWARVADVIDRPPRRAMTALHESVLPDRWSRPVAATAGLQWAWLAATAILAGSAALVSRAAATDVPFLTLAPLASVGIVVATFAPAGEPGGEASFATPMFGLGLILRRLMAALVPALVVLALSAALIADLGVDSLVWLLPALALATATLAVMTFASTRVAGVTTTAVWIATMVLVAADQQLDLLDRWRDVDLFDRRGQMIAVMVTVGSLLVIWLRREHISTPEVAW